MHVFLPIVLYNIGDYRLKLFISTPRMVRSDPPQIGTGISKKGTLIGHHFDSPFANDVYSVTLGNLRMMLVTYYGTQNIYQRKYLGP